MRGNAIRHTLKVDLRVSSRRSWWPFPALPESRYASSSASTGPSIPSPYVDGSGQTHFGFTKVSVDSKEERVRHVFANVADSYDVMNDLMSGGLHRFWKDHILHVSNVGPIASVVRQREQQQQQAQPTDSSRRLFSILDVAGGTGDVAFRFVDAAGCVERSKSSGLDPIHITVCDINHDMLRVGRDRAMRRFGSAVLESALSFRHGNAQDLVDFTDHSFDLYTIAFGLRNVTDVDLALREAWRVLKPGGRFMCLEFSHVPDPWLRHVYDAYSFALIPAMGEWVARDRASYQYLVESIRQFPRQDELVQRMRRAGFAKCSYTNLTFGVVALHEGWKPLDSKE